MGTARLWTVEDVANYLQTSKGWVYKRISAKSELQPKLPRVPNLSKPRFHPDDIIALFSHSSLKTELARKPSIQSPLGPFSQKKERKFEKL